MGKKRITVFTPTYNRGYIIEQLYRSLQRQSFHDFEWLVIDDGSSDETERLFGKWLRETNFFPIRYVKQPNGGKCRAINRGLDLAVGELFFTMDSDDYLTDDALEKVAHWFDELTDDRIVGIVANRGYSPTETQNCLFDEAYLDKSLLEIYSFRRNGRQVFDGERAFIFYTDFHRRYRYPEFEGENFMTESIAWNRMANDGYLVRYVNDIIWIFEYKEDGLTKAGNKMFKNNPMGYGLWLREKAMFEQASLRHRWKMYYTFSCELSTQWDARTIAAAMEVSPSVIRLCLLLHKTINMVRGEKA